MTSKGFTHIDLFNDNSGGWTLINATISGGVLDITAGWGYGQKSPDADWYSGATNDFEMEFDFRIDSDVTEGAEVFIKLVDDANPISFDVKGAQYDQMRILHDAVNRAIQSFTYVINTWYTGKIRRVGTTYYYSIDGGTELSWDYGTARAIEWIRLSIDTTTGDYDNFKYSWIKAVLEGAINFSGAVSKKQFKTLEGIISFIGTLSISKLYRKLLEGTISFVGVLSRKVSYKRVQEGAITFIGTLQRKLSLHRLLEGSISFIGTLLGSRLYKKTLEGAISFIGTLSRKRTFKRTLEGKISFIGTLGIRKLWSKLARAVASMSKLTRGDASMTKETRDAPSWTKEDK